jgi:hypothetical protein
MFIHSFVVDGGWVWPALLFHEVHGRDTSVHDGVSFDDLPKQKVTSGRILVATEKL